MESRTLPYYTLCLTKLKGGILFSPCPSVHLSLCLSVDRIVSALYLPQYSPRADSRYVPSQWETSLQSNAVSHWLGANLASALLAGSISYLHMLSCNFRRCVACEVFFKIKKFWQILQIYNFDFVLFWLRIQYESVVLVTIGWWGGGGGGVSSERRCSSCSSYLWNSVFGYDMVHFLKSTHSRYTQRLFRVSYPQHG